jgi:hypothetical protein
MLSWLSLFEYPARFPGLLPRHACRGHQADQRLPRLPDVKIPWLLLPIAALDLPSLAMASMSSSSLSFPLLHLIFEGLDAAHFYGPDIVLQLLIADESVAGLRKITMSFPPLARLAFRAIGA